MKLTSIQKTSLVISILAMSMCTLLNCYQFSAGSSFSIRDPKDETKRLDFEVATKLEVDDQSIEIIFERENDRHYRQRYIDLSFPWNFYFSEDFNEVRDIWDDKLGSYYEYYLFPSFLAVRAG